MWSGLLRPFARHDVEQPAPQAPPFGYSRVSAWNHPSATIGLRSTPMPLISTAIVSPGFIHSGGV